jgi:hypothetical protein
MIIASLHPKSLSIDWRIDPKQERRGRTPLEKNLKKENTRTRRKIVDFLGVFFSLLFFLCYAVV